MSTLERKWWYVALVALLATCCTLYLLESAGMPPMGEYGVANWIVYGLCAGALWRGMSFVGWLLVLGISPSLAGVRPKAGPPGSHK